MSIYLSLYHVYLENLKVFHPALQSHLMIIINYIKVITSSNTQGMILKSAGRKETENVKIKSSGNPYHIRPSSVISKYLVINKHSS